MVITTLSKAELRSNALEFANRWKGEYGEKQEAQTFLNEFFSVFGRDRRAIDAIFEQNSPKGDENKGFIDLFWPGKLVIEMKGSHVSDLQDATDQAFRYVRNISHPNDVPRYILISNFKEFHLHDLGDQPWKKAHTLAVEEAPDLRISCFKLDEFNKNLGAFAFIRDEELNLFQAQPDVNQKAVKLLAKLHDALEQDGFRGHALQRFLVRSLFCLFAEDTEIFEWNSFTKYVRASRADGSDLGGRLAELFKILDTEARQTSTRPELSAFPYINGGLFSERLDCPDMNSKHREALLDCCMFDWSKISPAVFGSLFQGVMDKGERREKGAHYTSEENILKVIEPLFVEELKAELARLKAMPATRSRENALREYHGKLSSLRFLDPACGCGNFLVTAFSNLRKLELETLLEIYPADSTGRRQTVLDISDLLKVNVGQFYGIELDEFPALIAETALWLTDHQLNMVVSKAFGRHFLRIPLRQSPSIRNDNALRTDWATLLPASQCHYILGNPPFVGARGKTANQKADVAYVFGDHKGAGDLDFVGCWYAKAARYMAANPSIRAALVSTNSITQGEQPGILWSFLRPLGVRIHFAYRTFKWENEASGNAAVHCVIIGFGLSDHQPRRIWETPDEQGRSEVHVASEINPYLVDAPFVCLSNRRKPLCSAKPMAFGSMPNDDKGLLSDISPADKDAIEREHPEVARAVLRQVVGSEEFINGTKRHCLWIREANLADASQIPAVRERVQKVRAKRLESSREATQELAETPYAWGEIRQPIQRYLFVPSTSSENRAYIPMAFLSPEIIATNAGLTIDGADAYDLGILTSSMHMAWTRSVCGRLEMRYRYSATVVYNNYPWPNPTPEQRGAIEAAANAVLAARQLLLDAGQSYAQIYDPDFMPGSVRQAHNRLNEAVDAAYGYTGPGSDSDRTAFLFKLFLLLDQPMASTGTMRTRRRRPN
jgi:hypothetical protein